MRHSATRIWIALIVLTLLASPSRAGGPKPNVLFIAIDDLNDWVGCLDSHPQVKTPNIDALAQRGTLFTNAHCQAPICNPSRTSVMTGLRPSTTGVYALAPWFRTVDELKELVTLPQHFSRAGYTTSTDSTQSAPTRRSCSSLPTVRRGRRIELVNSSSSLRRCSVNTDIASGH